MTVFNVSFANNKTRSASQDYGVLVDQLDIMESNLSADGKLSPGDYKLLTDRAMQIYGHPGLNPGQRSNIEVKIAGYKAAAAKVGLKDSQDITDLNNNVKDDQRTASILHGNNPVQFLKDQAAIQSAKIQHLAEAINTLDASGQDSSAHMNEYNDALQSYQDTLKALSVIQAHAPGQAPNSDYVAYLTTNSDGQITDVKVAREGAQSGYLETNGLYGGLRIYGRLNHKENGKNVFLLGNQRYSAADVVVPSADGSLKASTLINESGQKGKAGVFTTATAGYTDMDPGTQTQSAIRAGGYAEGSKGFIYKKNADGSYTKYVNATPENLKISPNDIIRLPNSMEQGIMNQVSSTIDSSLPPPALPVPPTMTPATSTPATSTPSVAAAPQLPAGSPSPKPTSSSPATFGSTAMGAIKSAGGFLSRLFGGQ